MSWQDKVLREDCMKEVRLKGAWEDGALKVSCGKMKGTEMKGMECLCHREESRVQERRRDFKVQAME